MAENAPLSPNQKHAQLGELLTKIVPKLDLVAPKEYDTQRFREVMLDILMATPDLLKCAETPKGKMSFALACAHIVELGLDPSKIRKQIYVVPFMNRKDNYMEAVVIPDARGLIELMRRSGKFKGICADVVYKGDEIEVMRAPEPNVIHKPKLDRVLPPLFWPDENDAAKPCVFNQILGFYAMLKIEGEEPIVKWWPRDEVMKVKNRSRAGGSGPWVTDFVPMGIKTAVKDAARHAPLSPDVSAAIALDEEPDSGVRVPIKADIGDIVTIDDSPGEEASALPAPTTKTEEARKRLEKKKAESKPASAAAPPTTESTTSETAPAPEAVETAPEPQSEPPAVEDLNVNPETGEIREPKSEAAPAKSEVTAEQKQEAASGSEEGLTIENEDGSTTTIANFKDVANYFGLPSVAEVWLSHLGAPSLLDLVRALRDMKETIGSMSEAFNLARKNQLRDWAVLTEWLGWEGGTASPIDQKLSEAEAAEQPAPEFEPLVDKYELTRANVGWLKVSGVDMKHLTWWFEFLDNQGVHVNAQLEKHRDEDRSVAEAMEADGFEVVE